MAVWQSHHVATKLCSVLDSELATIEEIAQASGFPPKFIERLATRPAIRIDRETEFRVTKVLAPYFRAHPELFREPLLRSKRGVFEVETRCGCFRGFLIKDSKGKKLRYVEIPTDECDENTEESLWRWLDRRDPILKVI